MKKINIIKKFFSAALVFCFGINVNAQCSFTGLESVYCSDGDVATLVGTPEGGEFSGPGVAGSTFDPTTAGSGDHVVTYNYEMVKEKYYIRSSAGEPWTSTANPTAMDMAFGVGEWSMAMFESLDPTEVFSEGTDFVYIDGSDNGALPLASFLSTNLSLIENWVDEGGRLLMNSAPNDGSDINFGFGGSTLVYSSPATSVDVVDLTHPAYVGPNSPTSSVMTGSSYSHAHITGSGFTNLLLSSADPSIIVLCEKSWGAGRVMMGGMTTHNFHSPIAESENWRANLLHYMGNYIGKVYLRSNVGEPWGSTSNTDAMDLAFGTGQWSMNFLETLDPETVFSSNNGFIFIDGSDLGAAALNTFLLANLEIIENWVNSGGSLLMNAAPNTGSDMNFGFDGSTLVYDSPSASVEGVDYTHPAFLGPNVPTTEIMTGSSYSHAHITGAGFTNVLTNSTDATNIVLCEKVWGQGNVMMGGMTTSNYHTPLLEANNFRANLLVYMSSLYDGYFCIAEQDVTVLEPLVIDFSTEDEIFGGDGSIDITVTGGLPSYTYDWDTDESGDFDDSEDLSGLVAGTYVITAADDFGCTTTETIVVNSQVGIETASQVAIKLYPNPTQGMTILDVDGNFTYQVFDMNGKAIMYGNGFNKVSLQLSDLENGIYFIQITADNVNQTIKVVKK